MKKFLLSDYVKKIIEAPGDELPSGGFDSIGDMNNTLDLDNDETSKGLSDLQKKSIKEIVGDIQLIQSSVSVLSDKFVKNNMSHQSTQVLKLAEEFDKIKKSLEKYL